MRLLSDQTARFVRLRMDGRGSVRPIRVIVVIVWRLFARRFGILRSMGSGWIIITAMPVGSRRSPICRIPVSVNVVWLSSQRILELVCLYIRLQNFLGVSLANCGGSGRHGD